MTKTVGIIGAGIGGLALSIRLANQGFKVTLFEKNSYPGGKLSELNINGPSKNLPPEASPYMLIVVCSKENLYKAHC
jgi:flavin-dependent dehydrogenase